MNLMYGIAIEIFLGKGKTHRRRWKREKNATVRHEHWLDGKSQNINNITQTAFVFLYLHFSKPRRTYHPPIQIGIIFVIQRINYLLNWKQNKMASFHSKVKKSEIGYKRKTFKLDLIWNIKKIDSPLYNAAESDDHLLHILHRHNSTMTYWPSLNLS